MSWIPERSAEVWGRERRASDILKYILYQVGEKYQHRAVPRIHILKCEIVSDIFTCWKEKQTLSCKNTNIELDKLHTSTFLLYIKYTAFTRCKPYKISYITVWSAIFIKIVCILNLWIRYEFFKRVPQSRFWENHITKLDI